MPVSIRILALPLLLSLSGSVCAAARTDAATATANSAAAAAATLEPALAGEFALQGGQLDAAARWYLQAAQAEAGDAGLAERATRIAMLANDDAAAAQALALWRQRAPQSVVMRGAEVSLALRRGDLRRARRGLRALLRDPDARGWRYALAALASTRDSDVMAKALTDLVQSGEIPERIEAWQEFGRLGLRLERPELTRHIVDQVVRRFPGEPRVALLRATQLSQDGRRDEARALLQGVEDRAASDSDLRGALALAYDAMGEAADAARVLAVGPQDTQTYGLRASLQAKQHDEAGLLALYGELRRDSSDPDPQRRLLLGKIAEYLKRFDEAVAWYRGVPGGPLRSEARLRGSNALFELGRRQEAFEQARALQADVEAPDEARRDAYLLEAELRQRAGDGEGELDVYARALAAYPDDSALLYARGLAWEQRDDIARAEADLRKILVTEPGNVTALNALGYTLADRTPRLKEALALIDRARTAEPDNPAIIDSYGWVLYRMGRGREALQQLRRAWSLFKDPEIAAHIGEVLWHSDQHEEARRYFEEARRLDPGNRALRRALEKIGR